MRAGCIKFIAAGLGALATLVTGTARAQVPIVEDQPAPTPAPAPKPAPLDLQQPGATPVPPPPATPAAPPAAAQPSDSTKVIGPPAGGLGLGVSGERVVKLHDPTNNFWQFAIDGGVMYGTSTSSKYSSTQIVGGGAEFNIQYRVGGQMPGTGGGSWNAFGVDLTGGVFGAGVIEKDTGAGLLLVGGSVTAGYQFMTFGTMDDSDLKQHGFGLFLGGKVGVANTQVFAQGPADSQTNPQYGPEIQLTFPEYNFGTTKRAAFYISGFLLPTGDFLLSNIQFGGSFN